MSHRLKLVWAACVALIVGTLIGATTLQKAGTGPQVGGDKGGERIVMITHGQASDPYWNIVRNGAEEAARQVRVSLDYRAPETFDMIRMADLIRSAANQRPAGIIVSIPDANALGPVVKEVAGSGVPIISINSGADVARSLGSLTHIGQDEYETGKKVGERLRLAGAGKVLCVNHEVGNVSLDARCRGVADGFGGAAPVLPTGMDYQEVTSKIAAALSGDREIDTVVTLNATQVGEPAVEAALAAGRPVRVASFDLSPRFLEALQRGDALFAVDPQAFLQGYLGVVLIANRVRYGVMPANPLIETGPLFVTRAEAGKVIALSKKSIR